MRKLFAPLILGSTLALGACATNPYGAYGSPYGGYGSGGYGSAGGMEAILGTILGASGSGYYGGQGYGGSSFQQAAVNACGSTAAGVHRRLLQHCRPLWRTGPDPPCSPDQPKHAARLRAGREPLRRPQLRLQLPERRPDHRLRHLAAAGGAIARPAS